MYPSQTRGLTQRLDKELWKLMEMATLIPSNLNKEGYHDEDFRINIPGVSESIPYVEVMA